MAFYGFDQPNIKTGQSTRSELNNALKKVKNGKSLDLDGEPTEVWKIKNFQFYWSSVTTFTRKMASKCGQKDVSYPFPKKVILVKRTTTGITLTSIIAKIYNLMLEFNPSLKQFYVET